jgi:hypothetical protein
MLRFIALFFLANTTFFTLAQDSLSKSFKHPGYFTLKLSACYWLSDDRKVLDYWEPTSLSDVGKSGPRMIRRAGNPIFPSLELIHHLARQKSVGASFGVCYSYSEVYTNFTNSKIESIGAFHFYRLNTAGTFDLQSHRLKFVYGLTYHNNGGLKIYLHPLNPEVRYVCKARAQLETDVFEVYSSKNLQNGGGYNYYSDSSVVCIETRKGYYNYIPALTIAFPTSFGIEKQFRISKNEFITGFNFSGSLREKYVALRIYFGICFGRYKAYPTGVMN